MKNNFVRHTHFVGVPVPPELEDVVNDCRDWMASEFGCKSGYGTPPHITLLAPFTLPSEFNEADVFEAAACAFEECAAKNILPFTANIRGFGSFAERTLFVNVEDSENWQNSHSVILKNFSVKIFSANSIKKSGRKFFPHLTVANRDIPQGAMDKALKHFAELELSEKFCVNEICVYARNSHGGWAEARRIGL